MLIMLDKCCCFGGRLRTGCSLDKEIEMMAALVREGV